MIYFLTAIGLTPSGSSTPHIYTKTIHRKTQSTQTIHNQHRLRTCILTRNEIAWMLQGFSCRVSVVVLIKYNEDGAECVPQISPTIPRIVPVRGIQGTPAIL